MAQYEFILNEEEVHDLIYIMRSWLSMYNKNEYSRLKTNITNILDALEGALDE
jgi:hypothetical protein